jgi:phospho-N-acetylmuramoyl-pentapeptide-transferase
VTVTIRFWIIAGLCAIAGLGIFYSEWLTRA